LTTDADATRYPDLKNLKGEPELIDRNPEG